MELINGRTAEEIKRGLRVCNGWCDSECPYSEIECGCANTMVRDALALIERLEAEQPRWISMEDMLPQDGQKVILVNSKSPSITLQGVYKADKTPDTIRVFGFGIGKATHWMPLPEQPKEGEA